LPSGGNFYSPGSIEMPETQELPVFAMTAKDEITFKTPDALLNGQATVDVIQSCIPSIKNAWNMPSLDLDAALIAIRIATYGEKMDVNTKVPNTLEERTYEVDLRNILDLQPLTYQQFTQSALKTFEEQRVFQLVNNDELSENEKLVRFNKSFNKLTELTVGLIIASIRQIDVGTEPVTDPAHIKEFIENAEQKFYTQITEHIEKQKQKFSVKPMTVQTEQEDIDKGAPETFEVPIMFDQSNFFAQKS
jgi:hypothetical protein